MDGKVGSRDSRFLWDVAKMARIRGICCRVVRKDPRFCRRTPTRPIRIATTAHTVDSNWRAASVTIVDLAAGTTVTGVELFEAVQTVSGIGQSKIGGHASINADRGVFQDEMRVGQKNRRSGQPTWASFWGDFSSVGSQLPSGYRGVRLRAPLVPRASERRYFQPRHV